MNRQEILHTLFMGRIDKRMSCRERQFTTKNGITVKPTGFTVEIYKG